MTGTLRRQRNAHCDMAYLSKPKVTNCDIEYHVVESKVSCN